MTLHAACAHVRAQELQRAAGGMRRTEQAALADAERLQSALDGTQGRVAALEGQLAAMAKDHAALKAQAAAERAAAESRCVHGCTRASSAGPSAHCARVAPAGQHAWARCQGP